MEPVTARHLYPDDQFALSLEVDPLIGNATERLSDRQEKLPMTKDRRMVCLRLLRMAALQVEIKGLNKKIRWTAKLILDWNRCLDQIESHKPPGVDLMEAAMTHAVLLDLSEEQMTLETDLWRTLDALPRRMAPDCIVDWKLVLPNTILEQTTFNGLADGIFDRFQFIFYYCQTRALKTMERILPKAQALLAASEEEPVGDGLVLKDLLERRPETIAAPDAVAVFVRVMRAV